MSDETLKMLLDKLPAIITAIGVILTGYWAYQSRKQSVENKGEIKTLAKAVNGQGEAFRKLTGEEAFARGEKSERDNPSGPTGAETDPIHVETSKK